MYQRNKLLLWTTLQIYENKSFFFNFGSTNKNFHWRWVEWNKPSKLDASQRAIHNNSWQTGNGCSFPGCSLVWNVSSTTPGSLTLAHGFTHDKSAPYWFSTPQATTNWNSYPLVEKTRSCKRDQIRVVFSRPYVDISPRIWGELQF